MLTRFTTHRLPRLLVLLSILFGTIVTGASPRHGLSAGRDVGSYTLASGAAAVCDTIINPADSNGESSSFLINPPAVFASPNWKSQNPLLKQPVRLNVVAGHIKPDGSFEALMGIQPVKDVAGFGSNPATFGGQPISLLNTFVGPVYQVRLTIEWRNSADTQTLGEVTVIQPVRRYLNGAQIESKSFDTCPPSVNVQLIAQGTTTGTVNLKFKADIRYGDPLYGTSLLWDDKPLAFEYLGGLGHSFYQVRMRVPASPAGPHTVKALRADGSSATFIYTVKPRIKITPNPSERDATVDVSLRGFAANEVVQIRWKKSNSWILVATVTTSNTGSANVDVKVPKFAKDGLQKVRADGATSAAQTNAFEVQGGPAVAVNQPAPTATASPTPTATNTPEPTVTPTLTNTPETTPEPTVEPIATNEPVTDPTVDPIATEEPTVEPIATVEPTVDPVATDEPVVDPVATGESVIDSTPEPDPAASV